MAVMAKQQAIEVLNDGQAMRGMVYRPDDGHRHPVVLLLHGFTGQRIEAGFMFVKLARALCERGLAAVTFDFRHSGESDGAFENMLVTGELADALTMTRWLQSQPFADRSQLAVVGFSLGGLLASCTQARSGAYAAMVLLAPTTVENICRYAEQRRIDGEVVLGPHVLHSQFFDDIATLDPLGDIVVHPRPTLLVQGAADTAVTPAVSQQYVDAMQQGAVCVTAHHIADADHNFSRPNPQTEMIDTVGRWLGDSLVA